LFAVEIYPRQPSPSLLATSASFDAVRAHNRADRRFARRGLIRAQPGFLEQVYVSETVLYNSVIVLLAGGYLVIVGLLAELTGLVGGGQSLPLAILVVFVASSCWRAAAFRGASTKCPPVRDAKFRSATYDYRKEWTTLTQRTASLTDPSALSETVARRLAEIFGVSRRHRLAFGWKRGERCPRGSTILSDSTLAANPTWRVAAAELCRLTHQRGEIVDLSSRAASTKCSAAAIS